MLMTSFLETLDSLAHEFSEEMKQEFEMSMIGESSKLLRASSSLNLSMPRIWSKGLDWMERVVLAPP
jgi:hypothetical protein